LIGKTSLRAAGRLFPLLGAMAGQDVGEPDWTTGRLWLLRVGLAKLRYPKEQASDWVWLIDHSAQIGQEKCLVIVGLRLADLPPSGECLRHEHVQLIHLRVLPDPDKDEVCRELDAACMRTGAPRAIVNDYGKDIHGGVQLFQAKHPQTCEIYDIAHKGACLLKHRLENDNRWAEFTRSVGQTKVAVQQTELACLLPPHQRSKSRYMNLETLLTWSTKTAALLRRPPEVLLAKTTRERLQQKLGWVCGYRQELAEWSEWHAVVTTAARRIGQWGLRRGSARALARTLKPLATHPSSQALVKEVVAFVAEQAACLRPEERLPASTEVLESCFGKLKAIEKDQAKNGFTGLVLSLGAVVGQTTTKIVRWALENCSVKNVREWCQENLGTTVQAQRRLVYASAKE
jgi:hypothetical protein